MIEKKRLKRNYIDVQTNIDDDGNLSEGILNITDLPEILSAGKNLFKFSPNFDVVDIGYPLYIEILDSGGDPIFHEVLEFQEKDDSINVVVYVYETTNPGDCTLTILSTIFVDRDGNPLNSDEITDQNYKYTHSLKINTKKKNQSQIIYSKYPQVTISEKRYSILEEKFDPNKQITISGSADYFLSDERVPILRARNDLFKKEYENGTIWFPYLSDEVLPVFNTIGFSYTSSIQRVLTPYQLYLNSPLYASSSRNLNDELISSINQPYYITYNKIPTERNATKNIKSFAVVDIFGLEPDSGHVSRIKVFGKSATKPNQSYELFYDGEVSQKNYLVSSSNYFVEIPIGVFSDKISVYDFETKTTSSIDPYSFWQTTSIKGAPSAKIASSSNYLLNPISIKPDNVLSGNQEIILEQKSEYSAKFTDNVVYSLIFDYSVEGNKYDNREPLLNIYASGSSFVSNTEYGAFVAEVPLTNKDDRFALDYSVKLPVNGVGDGIIRFLMRDGTSVSNIRILSETDFGFTPNIARLYVPIKIDHRNEFLDFKIEYFNDSLQQSNIVNEIYSVFFQGGNFYIFGDDSYVTGSQEVGDNSVIKSEGYKGLDEAKKNVLENNPLYYYYRTTTRGINSLYVKNNDNTLWAWGYNVSGQLGLGDKVNRSSPIQVGTLKNWASASAGDEYTIAVKTDGTIWGWGSNTYRRAGITGSGAASTSSPVQIGTETNWNKVFAGTNHSLGMKRDGSLWAWGRNNNGQLGLNDITTRSSPVQVGTETNWKDAAVAQATTVAIKNDGTLWSWGSNDSTSGRRTVETPTVVNRSLPVRIGTLSNWTSVVGNQYHYIALNTLGELWTWGEGGNGVLGQITDNLAKSSPVQIGTLKTWVSASAGKFHSLAVKNDGTLWGWGYNFRGALGQGDVISRSSPVQIGTGSNWLYTHGGQDFTFGIDRSGSFYAWGDNEFGQLGLDSTTHYSSSITISTASVRKLTSSLFGWSMHVGDPFNVGIVQNNVQFINEAGDYLDFQSYPAKLDMTFIGTSSKLSIIGESASLFWDGDKIKISGVEITASGITGSISPSSLPAGLVSGSPQTLEHLYGTNVVSSSNQRFVLGLAESDSPRFANLTIDGDLTARQYIVSSSVYIVTQSFSSGSTIFGDDILDTHQFTGSVYISGSLFATASNAISSSYALTASYFAGLITGQFTGSLTGSVTGSFIGDGSGSFSGSHWGYHQGTASLSGSFAGSLLGTASNSVTSSYSLFALSGSFASSSISSSYSITSSFAGSVVSASFASSSISSSYSITSSYSLSGSFASSSISSSYSITSSFAGSVVSASFASSSISSSYSITSSYSLSGSFASSSISASYSITSSYSLSSSFASSSISASYSITSSFAQQVPNFSGSVSGSFSGSVNGTVTGSFIGSFSGSLIVGQYTGSLTGSLIGVGSGSFSGSHFGYHEGNASLTGSYTGSFFGVGSGSFSGSHFGYHEGNASLTGSYTGSFFGIGSGSFSGSHFGYHEGNASLTGSYTGSFFGIGSGSFSGSHFGSHFGSASLTGSYKGTLDGVLKDGIVQNITSHRDPSNQTASNIISYFNNDGVFPEHFVYQNNDITFIDRRSILPNPLANPYVTYKGMLWSMSLSPNDSSRGFYPDDGTAYWRIKIGRSSILTQSIELHGNTTVFPDSTLTTQKLIVTRSSQATWPYGSPLSWDAPDGFFDPIAKIEGLQATGSLSGSFRGIGSGSFSGSFLGTGSYYGSGSRSFTGIGSSSFLGISSPGTASFQGLVSSGSYVQIYTASSTLIQGGGWICPSWAQKVTVICIGGGGAGGAGAVTTGADTTLWKTGGSGGNGGSVAIGEYAASIFQVGKRYDVTVGPGGVNTAGLNDAIDNPVLRNGGQSTFVYSTEVTYRHPVLIAPGGAGGRRGFTNSSITDIRTAYVITNSPFYGPSRNLQVGGIGGFGAVSGSANGVNSGVNHSDGFLNLSLYNSLNDNAGSAASQVCISLDAFDIPHPSSITISANNAYGGARPSNLNMLCQYGPSLAPTGGGGGSGYSRTTNATHRGGRGGNNLEFRPSRTTTNTAGLQNVFGLSIGVTTGQLYSTPPPATTLNMPYWQTFIGDGGRGGSTSDNYAASDGANFGGGGGGGRALINASNTDTRRLGGNGGNGVVIIISEA